MRERRPGADKATSGLTRRRVLKAGAALGALPLLPGCDGQHQPDPAERSPGAAGRKPNVLFVLSDAHRAQALGCYGNAHVRTPHFDRLARDGVRLKTAVSNTPICRPYRASMMSGRFSHHTGVLTNRTKDNPGMDASGAWIPGEQPTLGTQFKRGGYSCGYVGKWHLGNVRLDPGPMRLGFDDYWAAALRPAHTYYEWNYATSAEDSVQGSGRFRVDVETDLAIDFMTREHDKPFFLVVSWGPPHEPFEPPPEFDHYPNVPAPPNLRAAKSYTKAGALLSLGRYYGLVEAIDHAFGRLLKALDAAGLADDTIVVYTSDHGTMLGSHGAIGKEMPYSESTLVPFLVRWPGDVPPGTTLNMPFGAPDVLPSLCGLAGLSLPEGVDGQDFSARLRGLDEGPWQDAVYLTSHVPSFMERPGWRGLRSERWAFTRTQKRPLMLHDLRSDPFELRNLAGADPDRDAVFDEQLKLLMQAAGDGWSLG